VAGLITHRWCWEAAGIKRFYAIKPGVVIINAGQQPNYHNDLVLNFANSSKSKQQKSANGAVIINKVIPAQAGRTLVKAHQTAPKHQRCGSR